MDPEWQAEIIAAYLIDGQIEAVVQQDAETKRRDRDRANNKPVTKGAAPPRTDSM